MSILVMAGYTGVPNYDTGHWIIKLKARSTRTALKQCTNSRESLIESYILENQSLPPGKQQGKQGLLPCMSMNFTHGSMDSQENSVWKGEWSPSPALSLDILWLGVRQCQP